MPYISEVHVRFRHCDPAGIVFYPRYFEMINDVIEDWFGESLGLSFADMHQTSGVPTAEITTRFSAPSRQGDQLTFRVTPTRLGRTSLSYELTAHCNEELRLTTQATLVFIQSDGRPSPWPADLRARLEAQLREDQ